MLGSADPVRSGVQVTGSKLNRVHVLVRGYPGNLSLGNRIMGMKSLVTILEPALAADNVGCDECVARFREVNDPLDDCDDPNYDRW